MPRQPDVEAVRPDPTPLVVEPTYTGPFCSACGVRNPEDRRFCRSCGEPLRVAEQVVPVRPPWWRRVLDRLRGRRRFAAGDRPRGFRRRDVPTERPRRRWFRLPRRAAIGRFGPLILVLGLAGMGLGPLRQWVTEKFFSLTGQASSRLHEHFVSVSPVGASGSAPSRGHPAGLAVDGVRDTYFASTGRRGGAGATLTVRFADPVDVDRIGVLSGAPGAGFRAAPRPRTIEVTQPGADPVRLSLDDTADFQNKELRLHDVRTLTLTVVDVYPGQHGSAVVLREVQFFDRRR